MSKQKGHLNERFTRWRRSTLACRSPTPSGTRAKGKTDRRARNYRSRKRRGRQDSLINPHKRPPTEVASLPIRKLRELQDNVRPQLEVREARQLRALQERRQLAAGKLVSFLI
ncbi:hypothetical protein IC762_29775 [Bradyrhizobium genosp. L]|uniref:hypothetical protein n=1 Tax=Bradyrhizobium genosp. L TaxID=83637 RepID=UPI0018A2D23E|nr:hypothetical protein [Bradyrhizobium genosp. L]QPF83829.1 hypothetical protein IC762_29775 [Bradyrhizobium genosp. L]